MHCVLPGVIQGVSLLERLEKPVRAHTDGRTCGWTVASYDKCTVVRCIGRLSVIRGKDRPVKRSFCGRWKLWKPVRRLSVRGVAPILHSGTKWTRNTGHGPRSPLFSSDKRLLEAFQFQLYTELATMIPSNEHNKETFKLRHTL